MESDAYPKFIIRPDSGNPLEVIEKICAILFANGVKTTGNEDGYVTFQKYGIIWGDGITKENIDAILSWAESKGLSAANFAFGCGGYLMQDLNRDTHKMAIKCCAIKLKDGSIRDVFKQPVTDTGKTSKRGIQKNERFVKAFENGVAL